MKLVLTKVEREQVLLDILANEGINYLANSGVEMGYSRTHYNKVKKEGDCHEDVLLRILNSGGKLEFVDVEDDGDFSRTLTKESLKQAFTDIKDKEFIGYVLDSLKEQSDAEIGYWLIQYILYGEVVFG